MEHTASPLNSGNAGYHLVQYLSYTATKENTKKKIKLLFVTCCFGCKDCPHTHTHTHAHTHTHTHRHTKGENRFENTVLKRIHAQEVLSSRGTIKYEQLYSNMLFHRLHHKQTNDLTGQHVSS
jgi:hypothetical protein